MQCLSQCALKVFHIGTREVVEQRFDVSVSEDCEGHCTVVVLRLLYVQEEIDVDVRRLLYSHVVVLPVSCEHRILVLPYLCPWVGQ